MNRMTFLGKLGGCGICVSAGMLMAGARQSADEPKTRNPAEDKAKTKMGHWISDLVGSAQGKEERREIARLLESCGRACYRREMTSRVPDVKGNLEALLAELQKMMGPENVRREGQVIHVRYPMKSCICPVAKTVPVQLEEDLFCHCSCGWLQAAFGAVSQRLPKVECLESFRRGGKACRFDVTLV
jgi:hypothetical protein